MPEARIPTGQEIARCLAPGPAMGYVERGQVYRLSVTLSSCLILFVTLVFPSTYRHSSVSYPPLALDPLTRFCIDPLFSFPMRVSAAGQPTLCRNNGPHHACNQTKEVDTPRRGADAGNDHFNL